MIVGTGLHLCDRWGLLSYGTDCTAPAALDAVGSLADHLSMQAVPCACEQMLQRRQQELKQIMQDMHDMNQSILSSHQQAEALDAMLALTTSKMVQPHAALPQ